MRAFIGRRTFSSNRKRPSFSNDVKQRNRNIAYLVGAVTVTGLGLSYAAVPLYRMFCQVTGYGGTVKTHETSGDFSKQSKKELRPREVTVAPGSTMLAFFHAQNNSDEPVVGVSTYNVQPPKAGVYFTKIQCFCFEEQRLAPHEEVDMPVFFYIDPEFLDDPKMDDVNEITLSYTFFLSK